MTVGDVENFNKLVMFDIDIVGFWMTVGGVDIAHEVSNVVR